MTCVAVFLTAAMAGLNPGTCALSCLIKADIIAAGDNGSGNASTEKPGVWLKVHRVKGEWRWIVEQDAEQCHKGGVQW